MLQKYSSIQISTIKLHFNSHMELDLCLLMVHLFDNFILFTNEIFGQLVSNYSRYAANLNMNANCLIRCVCKKSFLSFSYFSMVIKKI